MAQHTKFQQRVRAILADGHTLYTERVTCRADGTVEIKGRIMHATAERWTWCVVLALRAAGVSCEAAGPGREARASVRDVPRFVAVVRPAHYTAPET
jgi:hypothetical protein